MGKPGSRREWVTERKIPQGSQRGGGGGHWRGLLQWERLWGGERPKEPGGEREEQEMLTGLLILFKCLG